jgi:hypothetical protein
MKKKYTGLLNPIAGNSNCSGRDLNPGSSP